MLITTDFCASKDATISVVIDDLVNSMMSDAEKDSGSLAVEILVDMDWIFVLVLILVEVGFVMVLWDCRCV